MQRCFLSKIDSTFYHSKDLAIGPWCFDNINDLKNVNFIEPFEKNNILSEHKKCFDMAHYLINKDMQQLDAQAKKVFFLRNQVRYLFLTYFLYSRYCLVKKFMQAYPIEQICFEDVAKPADLNSSNFLLIISTATTGWLICNIIKILQPTHDKWFYINREQSQSNNTEQKDVHMNCIFKGLIYKFKHVINRNLNIFKYVKGISPIIGILLSMVYFVRMVFKKPISSVNNLILYEPLQNFGYAFNEFEGVFNILKNHFVCFSTDKNSITNKYKKACVIAGPSEIIYNEQHQLEHIKFFVNGGNVFCVQHGGCYATIKNHFAGDLEYNYTGFISWGSRYQSYLNRKNIINDLPAPYLSILKDTYIYQTQEQILWITGIHYSIGDGLEYLYGTNTINYINNKLSLYHSLKPNIQKQIFYKVMENDYNDQIFDLLRLEFPTERVISKGLAIDYMLHSKIVILDYYGTPFYEAMSMNVPVLLCYLEYVPFFDEVASDVFQEFKSLNIVHETPEKLVNFLHAIYQTNIYSWWNSTEIQQVRKKFLKLYANNNYYVIPWLKAIIQGKI